MKWLIMAALLWAGTVPGIEPPAPDLEAIGIEQRLGVTVPGQLEFRDEAGQPVRLGDLWAGRPTILAMVYYECPMLCTLVLDGVVRSLRAVSFEPGKEFNVVAVSIDPTETPALALKKRATHVKAYGRSGAVDGWHFLTGEDPAIRRLAEVVGFRYRYNTQREEYEHAAGIMVLTPTGQVSRYLLGIEYSARDVRLALVEASAGQIGTWSDQALLYCFHYDPVRGRYGLAVTNLLRVGGVLVLAGLFGLIGTLLWRERHKEPA